MNPAWPLLVLGVLSLASVGVLSDVAADKTYYMDLWDDVNGEDLNIQDLIARNIDANSVTSNYQISITTIDLNAPGDSNFENIAVSGLAFFDNNALVQDAVHASRFFVDSNGVILGAGPNSGVLSMRGDGCYVNDLQLNLGNYENAVEFNNVEDIVFDSAYVTVNNVLKAEVLRTYGGQIAEQLGDLAITAAGGTVSFDDEHLVTTGDLNVRNAQVQGDLNVWGDLNIAGNFDMQGVQFSDTDDTVKIRGRTGNSADVSLVFDAGNPGTIKWLEDEKTWDLNPGISTTTWLEVGDLRIGGTSRVNAFGASGEGNDNLILNAQGSDAIYTNYDDGTGGMKFCNGSGTITARLLGSGYLLLGGSGDPTVKLEFTDGDNHINNVDVIYGSKTQTKLSLASYKRGEITDSTMAFHSANGFATKQVMLMDYEGLEISGNLDVNGITQLGDGGTTNYVAFAANGDLTFAGSAGFYPVRLAQSAQPTPDTGELVMWKDSDDGKIYMVYNDPDSGVKQVELT